MNACPLTASWSSGGSPKSHVSYLKGELITRVEGSGAEQRLVEYDTKSEAEAVREETGLVVRVTGLMAAFHVCSDPRGMGVILVYRAVPVGGTLAPGDDASEVRFFAPEELPRELAFASTRRALLRWRCGRASRSD